MADDRKSLMNKQISHVVWVIAGCFVLLFAQLNRIQILDASELQGNINNTRSFKRNFNQPRGQIITSDGEVVALSVPANEGSSFDEQRQYPHGNMYAHTVGYISFTGGASGVERQYNEQLIGDTGFSLEDVVQGGETKRDVVLTLDHGLQQASVAALGERQGSVVAIDPRNGDVLALWSFPSYDPTPLVSHNGAESTLAFRELREDESDPLLAKTYQERYFPGSTFKVVTAAAALESGQATLTEPSFEVSSGYKLPLSSSTLGNFGGSSCGGNLLELLVVSCNAGIAELGTEFVGPQEMTEQAKKFGFNEPIPFDLADSRGTAVSKFPTDFGAQVQNPSDDSPAGIFENSSALAQASIGQNDVAATPLQMALVAATIANDGEVPTPHVVKEIRDVEGEVEEKIEPDPFSRAISPTVASEIDEALVATAERGSAKKIAVSGIEIGAKTGTAQLGTEPQRSHAWMIAYAGPPDGEPEIAIAVLVNADPKNPNQTGGDVAAPIARDVIQEYFR